MPQGSSWQLTCQLELLQGDLDVLLGNPGVDGEQAEPEGGGGAHQLAPDRLHLQLHTRVGPPHLLQDNIYSFTYINTYARAADRIDLNADLDSNFNHNN